MTTRALPSLPAALALTLALGGACDAAPPTAGSSAPGPGAQVPKDMSEKTGDAEAAEAADPGDSSAVPKDLSPEPAAKPPLDRAALRATYPWLDDPGALDPVDRLVDRFSPPPGLRRREVEAGTFAAYLRDLPLAAPGTPVLSFAGETILGADHPNLAAVVAIDVGDGDLQQCADSIIRLHAEWLYTAGRDAQTYKAASGVPMPFKRYLAGERLVYQDKVLAWVKKKGPQARTHALLRAYLRSVFAWANTASLAAEAAKVDLEALRPGDFFVLGGFPGHAVLVLDLAEADDGRRALLLGQGYMPAQSFHVLRPGAGQSPWFVVDVGAGGVKTPFWEAFPWSSIRRLD